MRSPSLSFSFSSFLFFLHPSLLVSIPPTEMTVLLMSIRQCDHALNRQDGEEVCLSPSHGVYLVELELCFCVFCQCPSFEMSWTSSYSTVLICLLESLIWLSWILALQEKQIWLNVVEEVERLVEFLKGHLVAFRRWWCWL